VRGVVKEKRKRVEALQDWGKSEGLAWFYRHIQSTIIQPRFHSGMVRRTTGRAKIAGSTRKHAQNGYLVYEIWNSVILKRNQHRCQDRRWRRCFPSDEHTRTPPVHVRADSSPSVVVVRRYTSDVKAYLCSCLFYLRIRTTPERRENTLTDGTRTGGKTMSEGLPSSIAGVIVAVTLVTRLFTTLWGVTCDSR